jgi:hypothetical protein
MFSILIRKDVTLSGEEKIDDQFNLKIAAFRIVAKLTQAKYGIIRAAAVL